MSVKRMFDKGFGYSPSSFARVPGAVTLVGEWQEVNELPALTFALSGACVNEESVEGVQRQFS